VPAVLLGALGVSGLADTKPPDLKEQALRIFRLRYPGVRWQVERLITADFTGDGEADLAVQGNRERDFAVGVILGPIGPVSRMLSLRWRATGDDTSSDCVTSAAPVLSAEVPTLPANLWGCVGEEAPDEFCAGARRTQAWLRDAAARGTRGLRVTGEGCDALHLYWNPQSKSFDDWKEK
jgi:hypothetical protein